LSSMCHPMVFGFLEAPITAIDLGRRMGSSEFMIVQ
jgi:hypothetical protein